MRKCAFGSVAGALIAIGLAIGTVGSASAYTLNNDNGGDGFVVPIPGGFDLFGSDSAASGGNVGPNNTTYLDVAGANVVLGFNWSYHTDDFIPFFDSAGYVVNNIFHQLTNDNGPNDQSGLAILVIAAGQNFGLYVQSVDQQFGRGDIAVTAATVAPVPAALSLFATGLAGLGWLARRQRKQAA